MEKNNVEEIDTCTGLSYVINIRASQKTKEQIKELRIRTKKTSSQIIRELIQNEFQKHELNTETDHT